MKIKLLPRQEKSLNNVGWKYVFKIYKTLKELSYSFNTLLSLINS